MLHGRVVRPPSMGATVVQVHRTSVQKIAGLIQVVVKKNFVGVVAEKQFHAEQAAQSLKVTWKPGPPLPSQANFYEFVREQPSRDVMLVNSRDVDEKLKNATRSLKATYL